MKKLTWIIENFVKEKSYTNLANEVKKQNYDIYVINGDYKNSDLDFVLENSPVIFNGSIEMSKIVKTKLLEKGCYPISYNSFENYLCSAYYPYFEKFLFNDDYIFLPLESLNRRVWEFYGQFGKESMMFVRPDSGEKTFKAELVDLNDWNGFYEDVKQFSKDLVVVSSPKNIVGEWRFVVTKDKEILGVSSYKYQGLITRVPSAPKGATELVQEILNVEYFPNCVFCVDICQDTDGKFWMMELTSFSSAGLYECKMENIVKRVSEIALEDFDDMSLL